ncbi:TraB/GumN family protein [Novosphingobium sp. 9]|uniref:TraB/GumN family protein n=1 Tax=Novosphingobium sp. 9 TaxID=2025349 RepID=UPI0021B54FCE|nr:TraB/GumN family protein [Novosphingobium sp. 9]
MKLNLPTFRRAALLLALPLALAACAKAPQPANPALWKVESANGKIGYLFGTIHTAPRPLDWRTPAVGKALDASGTVMVEVANLADEKAVAATFARLAHGAGEPPLSQRVPAADRKALAALLAKGGYHDGDFAATDTWAAALMLARIGQGADDGKNGVDRAIIAAAPPRPVVELEGAEKQLSLFDSLSEADQRQFLSEVVREADTPDTDISQDWAKGDMTALTAETRRGLLAVPDLRAVLFTGRNRDWSGRIAAAIATGKRPFVAVGAAHMAGPDGLPAILASQGFRVTRVE